VRSSLPILMHVGSIAKPKNKSLGVNTERKIPNKYSILSLSKVGFPTSVIHFGSTFHFILRSDELTAVDLG